VVCGLILRISEVDKNEKKNSKNNPEENWKNKEINLLI
jgi:hypothetical protein